MTTQQFGTLEPFDGADLTDYSERLNAYFIAHNISQVAGRQEKSGRYNHLDRQNRLQYAQRSLSS